MRNLSYLLLLAVLGLVARPASANTYVLSTQGADPFTFSVSDTPTIDDFQPGAYFQTTASSVDFGEFAIGFGNADYPVQMFLAGQFGFIYLTGPQLYTGAEDNPHLLALPTEGASLTSLDGIAYVLAPAAVAATPEPATVFLILPGIALTLVARARLRTPV